MDKQTQRSAEAADSDCLVGLSELRTSLDTSRGRIRNVCRQFRVWVRHPKQAVRRWWRRGSRQSLQRLRTQFSWPELRRTASVASVVFLLLVVSGIVLKKLDPFGIGESVGAYSADVFSRIAAPFYASSAQDFIVVVLINEDTLVDRETAWPPRYTFYEEVVRRVLRYQPRVVYVDILIDSQRAYDSSLGNARDALTEDLATNAVPLVFAASQPDETSLFDMEGVSSAVAGWERTSGGYPLMVTERFRRTSANPAQTNEAGQRDVGGAPSVALALYDFACKDKKPGCMEDAIKLESSSRHGLMSIQWGAAVPLETIEHKLLPDDACTLVAPTKAERWAAALGATVANLVSGLLPSVVEQSRRACPYTLTLREQDLGRPEIGRLIENRVVLIGTNLVGLHDVVPTPLHGQIAGVYLHAMALDNLMTWGNGYYRQTNPNSWIVPVLVCMLLAIILSFLLRWRPRWMSGWIWVSALFVIASVSWFMYAKLHRTPLDWLGLLGLLALATVIEQSVRRRARHSVGVEKVEARTSNEDGS